MKMKMKIYAETILKRNIEFALFIALSAVSAILIITNIKLILSSKQPTLIAIDTNGTRIIKDSTDPIFNTEATAFIHKFISNTYNFTVENFMQHIGFSTSLMSEELWKSKKNSILSLKSKVESDEIQLTGNLEKLTKDEAGNYHALVSVREKTRLNTQNQKIEVTIRLKTVPRTQDNPWGLEVDQYEETLLRE